MSEFRITRKEDVMRDGVEGYLKPSARNDESMVFVHSVLGVFCFGSEGER